VETYELANITIVQQSFERSITFARAKLFIITEQGSRLWYIELDGVADDALLRRFAEAEDIRVNLSVTTVGGRLLTGSGYFHPNLLHRAAAIRGEGQLEGYGRPDGARTTE
jgi:hypothetical protein